MACFDTAIGISRSTCPCLPTLPEGAETSDSGLYLNELEPLNNIEGGTDCEGGSVWDILIKAREYGIMVAKADINAALLKQYQQRVTRFNGSVGEASGRDLVSTSHTYVGARLNFNPVKGGVAKITAIGTLFQSGATAGTLTVSFYNGLNVLIGTRTANIVSTGQHNTTVLSSPLELPTFVDYAPTSEYYAVYTYDSANKAKRNKAHCCCGGGCPPYNTSGNFGRNSRDWTQWLMLGGWSGDTLTDFDNQETTTYTDNVFGLTFKMDIGCDTSTIVCPDSMDYTRDASAMSIAFAVLYASAIKAANGILMSTKLTRSGMINRTAITDAKKDWEAKYATVIAYLQENLTLTNNDCLTCKDEVGYKISTMGTQRRYVNR